MFKDMWKILRDEEYVSHSDAQIMCSHSTPGQENSLNFTSVIH